MAKKSTLELLVLWWSYSLSKLLFECLYFLSWLLRLIPGSFRLNRLNCPTEYCHLPNKYCLCWSPSSRSSSRLKDFSLEYSVVGSTLIRKTTTTYCHLLSLDVSLVYLFINDRLNLPSVETRIKKKPNQ